MGCIYSALGNLKESEIKLKKGKKKKMKKMHMSNKDEFTPGNLVHKEQEVQEEQDSQLNHKVKSAQNEITNNANVTRIKMRTNPEETTPRSEQMPQASPAQSFKQILFEEINKLRTDPKNFSYSIENYIRFIQSEAKGKKHYLDHEFLTEKIQLKKGPGAFNDCIVFLQGLYPLPPLIYKENLEISFDHQSHNATKLDSSCWIKREILTELLEKKSNQLGTLYTGFGFHFDLNIKDPELSVVNQAVDDGRFLGQRRNNLLSLQFKYIGISHSDLDDKDKFCVYLHFAY